MNGWTLIGLSSLLLGALLLFVFALSNSFNPSKKDLFKAYLQPLALLPALLIITGLVTASIGYKTDTQEQESIKQMQAEIAALKLQYREADLVIKEGVNIIENKLNEPSTEEQNKYLEEFKDCIATKGLVRCL